MGFCRCLLQLALGSVSTFSRIAFMPLVVPRYRNITQGSAFLFFVVLSSAMPIISSQNCGFTTNKFGSFRIFSRSAWSICGGTLDPRRIAATDRPSSSACLPIRTHTVLSRTQTLDMQRSDAGERDTVKSPNESDDLCPCVLHTRVLRSDHLMELLVEVVGVEKELHGRHGL